MLSKQFVLIFMPCADEITCTQVLSIVYSNLWVHMPSWIPRYTRSGTNCNAQSLQPKT